ncbi:MAG: hypothetical protein RIC89_01585 [Pseudomonadales bacterium]
MKYLSVLLIAVVTMPLLAQQAAAEQGEPLCAEIGNARERLACYDRAYGSDTVPQPKIRTEVIAPRTLGQAPSARPPAAEAEVPAINAAVDEATAPTARKGTAAPPGQRSRGMFDRDEKVEFTAKVKALRAKDEQRMVFLLDNEQIWMQTAPRFVPIKEGDTVTIKSGTIGGFIMRSENDASTRVQRIQ